LIVAEARCGVNTNGERGDPRFGASRSPKRRHKQVLLARREPRRSDRLVRGGHPLESSTRVDAHGLIVTFSYVGVT
jgi:hypothetical protein